MLLMIAASAVALGLSALPAGAEFYESTPNFDNCGDPSFAKAARDGITIGVSEVPPYSSADPKTGKLTGIDIEILDNVMKWLNITKVKYEVLPWSSQVPSLIASRIDLIGTNIHITPDRLKVISFSGPAWWYGPAIVVKTGNPLGVHQIGDLKGKKVGVILGTAADEYMRKMGMNVEPFQVPAEEFASLEQGRVDALFEDDARFITYKEASPQTGLEMVKGVEIPTDLLGQGYGYARYALRKDDCSLRAAITQGLAEVRAAGDVSKSLKHFGFTDRNLFVFPIGQ